MKPLQQWIEQTKQIHNNIAADVFPNGGTLTCKQCGHSESITREDCAHSLRWGWKKHCGYTMTLDVVKTA